MKEEEVGLIGGTLQFRSEIEISNGETESNQREKIDVEEKK